MTTGKSILWGSDLQHTSGKLLTPAVFYQDQTTSFNTTTLLLTPYYLPEPKSFSGIVVPRTNTSAATSNFFLIASNETANGPTLRTANLGSLATNAIGEFTLSTSFSAGGFFWIGTKHSSGTSIAMPSARSYHPMLFPWKKIGWSSSQETLRVTGQTGSATTMPADITNLVSWGTNNVPILGLKFA